MSLFLSNFEDVFEDYRKGVEKLLNSPPPQQKHMFSTPWPFKKKRKTLTLPPQQQEEAIRPRKKKDGKSYACLKRRNGNRP
jgi:hypothetical protein